jgi:hypothetical protein
MPVTLQRFANSCLPGQIDNKLRGAREVRQRAVERHLYGQLM